MVLFKGVMTDDERSPIVVICGADGAASTRLANVVPAAATCVVVSHDPSSVSSALKDGTARMVTLATSVTNLDPGTVHVVGVDPQSRGQVDLILRDLAQSGDSCIAVVVDLLSADGLLGMQRIRETTGLVVSCNPAFETSCDAVMPFEELLTRLPGFVTDRLTPAALDTEVFAETSDPDTLRDILTMLRVRTGHDFTAYKRATIRRRIARRMQVCQTSTLADYHRHLRDRPTELAHLLRDLLISVTNFFRDREAFDALAALVVPRLFKNLKRDDQLRVWVAGCATGEEACSIGILLREHASTLTDAPEIQIFATDIDERALQQARSGVYAHTIETDVSPARLGRFFTRENEDYRVVQELREMMLFSPHNLLRDPPFSRVDLISCRNLLIYLNRDAQERTLSTFHFALKPGGVLLLGSSESAEGTQQFAPISPKAHLFERRLGASTLTPEGLVSSPRWRPLRAPTIPPTSERSPASFGELHHRIVEQYAPPSVLVNEELDVVHVSQHAGRFLTVQGGEPTRQILRLVHPSLCFELRGAIYAARQPDRGQDTRVVKFDEDGTTRIVEVRVRSIDLQDLHPGTLLVTFDELNSEAASLLPVTTPQLEPVVREMEEELNRTRDQLRSTIEQYETSLEELKASNEELHAMNEELRSTTEELETGKEELQSVNEELSTLNNELKDKVDEVSRVNSDLQNLMSSTDIGVLFLDRTLHIKRFTPRAKDLFNIIPTDVGRPLHHVTHELDTNDLVSLAERVLVDLRIVERETMSKRGERYLMRFLPYRSLDDRIEGVVITFVEVTKLKRAEEARDRTEEALRTVEDRLSFALRGAPIAVLAQDAKLHTTWAWLHGRELGSSERDSLSLFTTEGMAQFRDTQRTVLASGTATRVELPVRINGSQRTYDFLVEPGRGHGSYDALTAVGFDVTPNKLAVESLRETDRRKDEFLATLSHELRNPLTPLRISVDILQMPNATDAARQHAYTVMERELQTLVRLVDELLDLSRVTHGKVELDMQPVDLLRVIEAALDSSRSEVEKARHRLDVQLPPGPVVVNGDAGRLAQVVTNLLINAVKYTPEGGRISVQLERLGLDRARIAVTDTGVGIEAKLLPRIFEIFVQSRDEHSRSKGGLGVGLNLVSKLVQLYGGTVAAQSDGPGQGARFCVELPLRG